MIFTVPFLAFTVSGYLIFSPKIFDDATGVIKVIVASTQNLVKIDGDSHKLPIGQNFSYLILTKHLLDY